MCVLSHLFESFKLFIILSSSESLPGVLDYILFNQLYFYIQIKMHQKDQAKSPYSNLNKYEKEN